jgi:quercetin dioxygenase-like cupin family protein
MFLSIFLAAALSASAPSSPQVWSADTIPWSEARPGGAQRTILEGELSAEGEVVSYAFRMPDGAWFPAHTHSSAARVFVLKGVLLLGEGSTSDRSRVRRIKAGEVVLVPAGLPHFEGAEGETVIIGVAIGPWTTRFLENTAAPVVKPAAK